MDDLNVLALAQPFDTQAENRRQGWCVKLGGITAQTVRAVIQTSALGKQHVCLKTSIFITIGIGLSCDG